MAQVTVGVLHPGEMGSVVGGIARAGGARVLWASEGRSQTSRARAEATGLTDIGKSGDGHFPIYRPAWNLRFAEASGRPGDS